MLKKSFILVLFSFIALVGANQVSAVPSSCDLNPSFCFEEDQSGDIGSIPLESAFEYYSDGTLSSVDINGEEFYNGEYSVVEWEYDYNQLNQFFYAGRMTVNQLVLPTYEASYMPNDYTFLMYKTQLLKYDPVLYGDMEYALGIYEIAIQDSIKWQETVIDNTVDELITYTFSLGGIEIDHAPETFADFLNIFEQQFVNTSCKVMGDYEFSDVEKNSLEYMCTQAKEKLQHPSENQYLKDINYFEIIPEENQRSALKTVYDFMYKKLEGAGVDLSSMFKAAKLSYIVTDYLVMFVKIYQAQTSINLYNDVLDQLETLLPMFEAEFKGKDIRIDYTIQIDGDRTPFYLDEGVGVVEVDVEEMEYLFDSRSTHIFFSATENDVLQKVMYTTSSTSTYGTSGIRGNLKVYKSNEFLDELDNYLVSKRNLITAIPVGTSNAVTTFFLGGDERNVDSEEFNMFTTHQNVTERPEIAVEEVVQNISQTSATLNISHVNNYDNLLKSYVYVYSGEEVIYEVELDDIQSEGFQHQLTGLSDSQPFYVKVLTYFHDANSYQTLIEMNDMIFITKNYAPELIDPTIIEYTTKTSAGFDIDLDDLHSNFINMELVVCDVEYTGDIEPCTDNVIYQEDWTNLSALVHMLTLSPSKSYSYYLSVDYLHPDSNLVETSVVASGELNTKGTDYNSPTVYLNLNGFTDTKMRITTELNPYDTTKFNYLDYSKLNVEVYNETGRLVTQYQALKELSVREITNLQEGEDYTVKVKIRYYDIENSVYVYEYVAIDTESTLVNGGGSIGGPKFFEQ